MDNLTDNTLVPDSPSFIPESPAPGPATNRPFPLWGAALMAVVFGIGLLLTWRSLYPGSQPEATPSPSPTSTPTPTPIREPSLLATQSAFLSLQAEVASVSGQLRNYVVEDPSLSPPVLDLPLGF